MMQNIQITAAILLLGVGCSEPNTQTNKVEEALKTINSRQYRCIRKPSDVDDFLMSHIDPVDVMTRQGFDSTRAMVAPDPALLKPPRWESETLVVDCVMYMPSRTLQDHLLATRFQFVFVDGKPKRSESDLPNISFKPVRAPEVINGAFGSPVEGFLKVVVDQGTIHIAVGAPPDATRVLWTTAEATQTFQSFEEFAKIGVLENPKSMARFVHELNQVMSAGGLGYNEHLSPITDAAAYKADYRAKGSHTYKLRYENDQIRETLFTIEDWDVIQDPRITNGRLIAFFHDTQNQPHRLEVDLDALEWKTSTNPTPVFTERVVSDTGRPLSPE